MAPRSLFPSQQAQYAQVFLLKLVPFCTLFAGLGSTNKSATSLLLLSDSCSVLIILSSSPSFLLCQSLWQIWQELSLLSSCAIRLQWVPGQSFLLRNDATDELARQGALLMLSAIPCSLSPLYLSYPLLSFLGLEAYCLHLNSLTHRFPGFPSRKLCSLVTLAVFSLVYAATDTVFC